VAGRTGDKLALLNDEQAAILQGVQENDFVKPPANQVTDGSTIAGLYNCFKEFLTKYHRTATQGKLLCRRQNCWECYR